MQTCIFPSWFFPTLRITDLGSEIVLRTQEGESGLSRLGAREVGKGGSSYKFPQESSATCQILTAVSMSTWLTQPQP